MAYYQYEPLSEENQEIRLLQLSRAPQAGSVDSIETTLQIVSLHDKPQYTALSYAWGDPSQTAPVPVNGCNFNVSTNLHAALRQLQRDGLSELLWVDAICINQSDDEEKSWQVQQMTTLYEGAATVLIWLGGSADNSDEAIDELGSIGALALRAGVLQLLDESIESVQRRRTLSDILNQNASERRVLEDGSVENLVLQLDSSTVFRSQMMQAAIHSLLNRQLWRRAWIVQEICISNQAYIVCGDGRLCIDMFDAALATVILCQEALYSVRNDLDECFPLLKPALLNLRALQHRRKRKIGQKPRLSSMLMHQHRRGLEHAFLAASDPRDVVFALLGVAGDTVARPPLGSILGIKSDYTKSTSVVFTETTKAFLGFCPWYRLEYCTFPKSRHDLPSWVPDWKKIAAEGVSCNPISFWNVFNASPDKLQRPLLSSATPILLRLGCCADATADVLDPPEWISVEVEGSRVKDRYAWLQAVRDFGGLRSPSRFQEEVWRTFVADIQRDRRTGKSFRTDETWMEMTSKIFSEEEKVMADWSNEGLASVREQLPFYGQVWWEPTGPNTTVDKKQLITHSHTLLSWAEWIGYGRTLFRTSQGRMGLGPEHMKVGDIITIISGTQAPIILRRVDENFYEYVGEAYVHGIMDGEFMATNPPKQIFKLI